MAGWRSISSRFLMVCAGVIALMLCPIARAAQSLQVYLVGNSLTEAVNLPSLQSLASGQGNTLQVGKNLRWGGSLHYMWDNPADVSATLAPYNGYQNAFANYSWDAVVLQPFGSPLYGAAGDRTHSANFINLARGQSPGAQYYLYEQWPQRADDGTLNYDSNWLTAYSGGDDETVRTRNYYETLTHLVRSDFGSLAKPVLLIPAGEVMYELNQRMHAGQISGYTDITQFYADNIHLNPVGSYMLTMTFYAALFKASPVGLPYDSSIITNPDLAASIQDAVWDVVSTHPLAGIPEPTTLAGVGLIGLVVATARPRRRR